MCKNNSTVPVVIIVDVLLPTEKKSSSHMTLLYIYIYKQHHNPCQDLAKTCGRNKQTKHPVIYQDFAYFTRKDTAKSRITNKRHKIREKENKALKKNARYYMGSNTLLYAKVMTVAAVLFSIL